MADSTRGDISWYSPDPRAIIPLNAFRVSRSLRRVMRNRFFETRVDTAFHDVIRGCAARDDTWISDEIINTYVELNKKGFAHSVESWREGELVGGLYGVSLSGAFFGESMFSLVSNASKIALIHLVCVLKERGFRLLDTQFINNHLKQFGAIEVSRHLYLKMLAEALESKVQFRER